MDLEYTMDTLPPALKDFYTLKDGTYHLNVKEHPKLAEFRTSNVALMKENNDWKTRYEGIDPVVVGTERAELAELKKSNPRITALEAENTELRAKASAAAASANRTKLRAGIEAKALAAGALPKGVGMLTDKAEEKFTIEGDTIKAKPGLFSPDRPGEALTIDDWLLIAGQEYSFLFKPTTGSGSRGSGSASGTADGVRVLRNPTEKQLGAAATDILKGKIRVEHDSQ